MVPRYSRPAMTAIWAAENRFRIWWQIEVFAAEAMGQIGMIPAEDATTIRKAYDADALGEIDGAILACEIDVAPRRSYVGSVWLSDGTEALRLLGSQRIDVAVLAVLAVGTGILSLWVPPPTT